MTPARQRPPLAETVRRLVAAGSAAMVFALTVFVASPVLHDWLHGQGGPAGDDTCAVVLFASGVPLALTTPAVLPPSVEWHEPSHVEGAEFILLSPRYLRQPERGPPVLG